MVQIMVRPSWASRFRRDMHWVHDELSRPLKGLIGGFQVAERTMKSKVRFREEKQFSVVLEKNHF